ncbi:MAG: hypothetical protein ACHBNF_00780, partial [Chromatiales bacterium]
MILRKAGRNNDRNRGCRLMSFRALQSDFWKFVTLFIGLAFSVATANAQTDDDTDISFHPLANLGKGWGARLDMFNIGKDISPVQLFAYDATGQLLGEIPTGEPLGPGEQRRYSQTHWPQETVTIKVESSNSVNSFMTLQSKDGTGLESVIPSISPTETLAFPLPRIAGEKVLSQLTLLNTGSAPARLEIIAYDREGQVLDTVQLSDLQSMESVTVAPKNLFDSSVLAATATLHVTGEQPMAGLEVAVSNHRADPAIIPGTIGLGTQLFVPIFQQSGDPALWTIATVLNPGDEPVSVSAEVFDAEQNSLGHLGDLSFLPGHASHNLLTENAGGTLPADAAFLLVSADQPIRASTLVGASKARGLTAAGALSDNDAARGYELRGADDATVLAAVPHMVGEDGTSQSALPDIGARSWATRVFQPQESMLSTDSQALAASTSTCSSIQPISFGALPTPGAIAASVDCFTFTGAVGDTVRVRAIKTSGTFDPLAEVVRPNGQTCAGPFTNDEFNCAVNSAGTHT